MRPNDTIRCSSCGRTQDQVWRMIVRAGNNNVYICDECVELCSEILGEKLKGQDEGESPALINIRLLKPKGIKAFLDKYIIEQDGAKKVLSAAVYNRHKRMTVCQNMDVDIQRSNILMARPTGSGKTYLAQTLVKILNVPFTIADTTALTEAGYMGEDMENTLLKLIQAVDHDIPRAEYGIICTGEIDETTKKFENISITRDAPDEGARQALLRVLEDTVVSVPPQGNRKHPHQEFLQIGTTNILSTCGSTFDGLERIVEQHLNAGSIGFNAEAANKNDLDIDELLKRVEPKDLTRFGLIPEFIGCVPVIVSLEQLTKDAMVHVLSEPKNALVRQYQKLFELDSIKLEFTQGALKEITQPAVDRKIGARGLRFILGLVMMGLMYKIPSDDFVGVCTITRGVAKKAGQPELVYHDMPPASAQKPLSEWLKGDSKTGEIAQAVVLL